MAQRALMTRWFGWECGSDDPKWFSISIMAPYLFKAGKGAQVFCFFRVACDVGGVEGLDWADESLDRKSVGISSVAGTDNKSNEGLSIKRSTTRWSLMIINMQLSSVLSRAKIDLRLNWRPRDENKLADALTDGDFTDVSASKRVNLKLEGIPLDVVEKLWQTKVAFDEAGASPNIVGATSSSSRKFDKSPW